MERDEELAKAIKDEFAFRHGYTEGDVTDPELLSELFGRDSENQLRYPPMREKSSIWLKDAKAVAYVSHTYGLDRACLAELSLFCLTTEMHVFVDAASWHYPGQTVAIVYTKQRWDPVQGLYKR